MAEAMPDWFVILICGGLVTLLLGCWLSAVVVIMRSRWGVPGANCC